MNSHNCNLNIHYTAPDEIWDKIELVYKEMPYWIGFIKGIPYWYGEESEEKCIWASVEPSGIQFAGNLPLEEWNNWLELLKSKLTKVLEYEIGELEDGFEFKYYD